jgi:hypothetical protein
MVLFCITINNQNNHVSAWLSIGLSAREKLLLDKIQNFLVAREVFNFQNIIV